MTGGGGGKTVKTPLWDQQLAAILVRPLVGTGITPNHVTTLSLAVALIGAELFATGDSVAANWGAGLFMAGRFLDHFDGELARQSDQVSRFGFVYDYVTGGLSYSALFAALGIGLRDGLIGGWSIWLGILAAPVIVTTTVLALRLADRAERSDGGDDEDSRDYPGYAGFELEDGIYLIGPIIWLGWIEPFFLLGAAGVLLFGVWTLLRALRPAARRGR
jgi:phosphatidylglycerophosphate synthase